jgi:hypothetical protein
LKRLTEPESLSRQRVQAVLLCGFSIFIILAGIPLNKPEKLSKQAEPPLTFSGSKEAPVAFIEWKVPSFAFAKRDVQLGYIEEATNIIHEMSGGKQPKDHIWVNVVHAVDGAWGIAGVALTNEELGQAASKG